MIRLKGVGKRYKDFWALEDVNLEIQRGEAVGLVGPNGAGKSTLLKLIARVIAPTTGTIELQGRVGALLEVGTGFHHELTGRENIFLSGAILGMHRSEVKRQFDAIVAFSGVEDFLDLPVKKYSTGMYLRLAFSVMAHLESEILLIDEILSVGDVGFQEKCLKKLEELISEGRTLILVSHHHLTLEKMCNRVHEITRLHPLEA